MKNLIVITAMLLMGCAHNAQNKSLSISELSSVMAYGTIFELNDINPNIEKDLLVRLYQVPVFDENCFVETHGVCWNKYYISVSTFDEYPETNVFKLNMVGELINTQWIQDDQSDYVEIEFTLNKYTKEAIANNHSLVNTPSKILLKMNQKSFVETAR